MAGPPVVIFLPIISVFLLQICMVCLCIKMARASRNSRDILSEMPDDPVYSGPNGEMVTVPYIEEKMKSSLGAFWCCVTGMMPKVRGLPQGVSPLPSYEKEELLGRLAGNWKIQPLESAAGNMFPYENLFVSGDKIIMSGGTHNAYSGTGSNRHRVARANETQEARIVPFRGKDGALYLDQIGSRVNRESIDGGEIELDNAMGIRIMLQREWKRQGLSPPPPATAHHPAADAGYGFASPATNPIAVVATPVPSVPVPSDDGGGDDDIESKIAQLQRLRDRGALTEEEFGDAKVRLLNRWADGRV